MKKLIFLFLFMFSFNVFCEENEGLDELILEIEETKKPDEQNIEETIEQEQVEEQIQEQEPEAKATVEKNKVVKNDPLEDVEEYHYSYTPIEEGEGYKDGVYRGRSGKFFISFFGELASYKDGPKRSGFVADVGWLVDLKYFYLGIAATTGYRSASDSDPDEEHLFIGFKTSFRYELLDWMIPFIDLGAEFVNVQTEGYWQYPVILYGGGVIFDLGHIFVNDRSFANNHRIWGMERLGFVVGIYGLQNLSDDPYARNAISARFGISLEI